MSASSSSSYSQTPTTQLEKIKSLLGQGLSNQVVANATGVSPSYISQLLSNETFASEITALRVTQLTQTNARDRSIDALEDKVLAKLEQAIEFFNKPRDLLSIFHVLNRAVRRGVPASESTTVHQQIVNIHVPAIPMQRFVKNSFGEVIEVEGQTLVTMPTHTLLKKLAEDSSLSAAHSVNAQKDRRQQAQTRVTPTSANSERLHFSTSSPSSKATNNAGKEQELPTENRYKEVAKHLPAVSFSTSRS